MSTNTPAKPKNLLTPVGKAVGYVNVTRADFKFDDAGVFKLRLGIERGNAAGQAMFKAISDAADAKLDEVLAKCAEDKAFKAKFKGKKPKLADLPIGVDEDNDVFEFSFKSKASFVSKKTGDTIERVIPVFDAKGKRMKPEDIPAFGAGSTVRVEYSMEPFFTVAVGAGVSLRMYSVQLINAVGYESSRNPYGDESGGEDSDDDTGSDAGEGAWDAEDPGAGAEGDGDW